MTKKLKAVFYAEVTDTFGGEANYCWSHKYHIRANTHLGAIRKLAKYEGLSFRLDWDTGDLRRYSAKGACICAFVEVFDPDSRSQQEIEGVLL